MTARLAVALGVLAVVIGVVATSIPRAETRDERVARISSELRCPVCQGLSVADSPSDTAREMRGLVEQRVDEGRTDEEIRAEFRAAYGDWILLSPPVLDPRGLVWIAPLAAILAGLALVALRFRRVPPAPRPTAEQLALLQAREATLPDGAE